MDSETATGGHSERLRLKNNGQIKKKIRSVFFYGV